MFREFQYPKILWWEKILLWFYRPRVVHDPGEGWTLVYKIMKGKIYVLEEYRVDQRYPDHNSWQ